MRWEGGSGGGRGGESGRGSDDDGYAWCRLGGWVVGVCACACVSVSVCARQRSERAGGDGLWCSARAGAQQQERCRRVERTGARAARSSSEGWMKVEALGGSWEMGVVEVVVCMVYVHAR